MRRLFTTGLIAAALLLAGFSAGASAQDAYYPNVGPQPTVATGPAPSPTPFGGLGAAFAQQGGPTSATTPATPAAPAATDTDAPQLAFTGGESEVLAYVGSGMIAVGGIALAVRRRLNQD